MIEIAKEKFEEVKDNDVIKGSYTIEKEGQRSDGTKVLEISFADEKDEVRIYKYHMKKLRGN